MNGLGLSPSPELDGAPLRSKRCARNVDMAEYLNLSSEMPLEWVRLCYIIHLEQIFCSNE
jgi:hypothetical protein